jgi:hypothetical protein
MKKIASLLLVFYGIVVIITGCKKEESDYGSFFCTQSGCNAVVYRVMGWYSDSIFYAGNRIDHIYKYYLYNNTVNSKSLFEYSGNQVKIFVGDFSMNSGRYTAYYTLSYKNSKISQVDTNSGRAKADYYYSGNVLKYILYYKEKALSDSLAVQYDADGNNIVKMLWYKRDLNNKKYQLVDSYNYTYDDKINPHKNSNHFLYNFYDCGELSLNFFNLNNIKTMNSDYYNIKSTLLYNDNNYPISVINTSVDAIYPYIEIERDDFFYQCK